MKINFTHLVAAAAALSIPVLLGACESLAGSSASAGSISSISASSMAASQDGSQAHYQEDVRSAAQSAIAAGASEREVLRSVGRVAESHGISDWESVGSTYVAIGKAIKLAGEDAGTAAELAPKLAGNNEQAKRLVLQGYGS